MIESGQLPAADVIELVEAQATLWVRVAAVRRDDQWNATHVEMTSGVVPESWKQSRWRYDEVVFLSCQISGIEGAAWLRSHEAEIDGVNVRLAETLDDQLVQWEKLASMPKNRLFARAKWPSTIYDLPLRLSASETRFGSLIGGGPSFISFREAVAAYFGFDLGPSVSIDYKTFVFQQADLRGRIAKVLIGSTDIEVHLEGDALDGMTVELASMVPGPTTELSHISPQVVRFALPHGLPTGAWVVLKKQSEWIDRKFINYPNALNADPGVEVVVEPTTELEALVSGGEGPTVEFKSEVPAPGTKSRDKVCATVAAFANGDGGHILFGVADDGAIVGLGEVDTQKKCDEISQFVSSTVTPLPHFGVERVSYVSNDGNPIDIIVLAVDQGDRPAYGIHAAHPKYYVRRGATTFEASSDQVRALARSRPPADQMSQALYGLRGL